MLLKNLEGKAERDAQFKTVICLLLNNKEYLFAGVCKGKINSEEKGNLGFGYYAVFIPDEADKTFAEMEMEEKNKYSHRKKALVQLITFLNDRNGQS